MRTYAALCTLFVLACCNALAAPATRVALHIEAQPMRLALKDLGEQTGLQIMFRSEDVAKDGMTAPRISGDLSAREALDRMLANTGLKYRFVNANTVLISAQGAAKETAASAASGLRLARGDAAETGGTIEDQLERAQPARSDTTGAIEEVVVTAQKREERLLEVPVPVTALNARRLADNGQVQLQDYFTRVPGLGFAILGDQNKPSVNIRGITSGGISNPTVAIVVDEVPYGILISPTISPSAPDIDPADLQRVEVLRGPQGTLYGAASLGGLLKFVTVDPSTEAFSGRIQAGTETVSGGSDLGHTLRASVNVPLGETFALRASGFSVRNPGYIDNVSTGQKDLNSRDNNGGRLSGLWRPNDAFSLKLGALYQRSERNGSSDANTSLGELKNAMLRGTGTYERETQAYSALANLELGKVSFTSISGYNVDEIQTNSDLTPFASVRNLAINNFGVSAVPSPETIRIANITQELRATVPLGERVEWLVGGFYADERIRDDYSFQAADPATGSVVGTTYTANVPTDFREYALFTDVTFKLTDEFDVQVGGRYSWNKETFSSVRNGPGAQLFYGANPSVLPEVESSEQAVTYLVTPRLKLSEDFMMYARFASGYRPGSPNAFCGSVGIPCTVAHDTTENYELGMKGSALGNLLTFDASLYYIDWRDMQISVISPLGSAYVANASNAKSQGVELSMEMRPVQGLTISGWVAFSIAELTDNFPATASAVGVRGDRLPYSSPFSGNLTIEQEFPLGAAIRANVGGSLSYVDDRKGVFRAGPLRQTFPSYAQVDLRAGASYEAWTLNVYLNNATDKRAIFRGGLDSFGGLPNLFTFNQPRTLGVSLSREF